MPGELELSEHLQASQHFWFARWSWVDEGRREQAISYMDAAISLAPSNPVFRWQRADFLMQLENWGRALQDCEAWVRLRPNDARAYFSRGYCYEHTHEGQQVAYERAVLDYSKAIELNSATALYYAQRGKCLAETDRPVEALADFTRWVELRPSVKAYQVRGACLLALGQFEKAASDFTASIAIEPNDVDTLFLRAECYASIGMRQAAIEDWDAILNLQPENAKAYSRRGVCQVERGKYTRAIEDYGEAIELKPEQALYYLLRAEACRHLAEADEARARELKERKARSTD
jgi:tetratricopeptide (TPR) repeat protein